MHLSPHHIALLLTLSGLGTSAFFFAQGTTELAASKLLAVSIPTNAGQQRSGPPIAPNMLGRRNRSTRAIMERNIFVPPLPPDQIAAEATPGGPAVTYEPGQEPACASELKLVGAMVAPGAPEWSYAALVQGQGPAHLFRSGMPFGGRTVGEISAARILLMDSSGTPCQIAMFSPEQAPATPTVPTVVSAGTPATASPTPAAGAEITPAEMDEGITRESDTRFSVQRGLLDRALSQQESIFRTARLVPHEENGQTVGMRVYGIRRSSLLGRLGVQNGDMLRSMNGFEMNDADAMLTALGRLRSAENLSLNVVRRGSPVTIDYSVR